MSLAREVLTIVIVTILAFLLFTFNAKSDLAHFLDLTLEELNNIYVIEPWYANMNPNFALFFMCAIIATAILKPKRETCEEIAQ